MRQNLMRFCVLWCCAWAWPVAQADSLKVGLGELDYPPFYFTENEELKGAAIEIAEALAEHANHQLHYHRVPWSRLQKMLKLGQIDMVILYFKTEERAQDVIYTRSPHLYENSYLVVPTELDVHYSGDLRDLDQYNFFNVRGYSHGAEYDNADYLIKEDVNNETELLLRVASGRNFIGVGNKPALQLYAEKVGVADKIHFLLPPIDHGANFMAFSRKNANAAVLAEQFSEAFDDFKSSEDYKAILRRYGFND